VIDGFIRVLGTVAQIADALDRKQDPPLSLRVSMAIQAEGILPDGHTGRLSRWPLALTDGPNLRSGREVASYWLVADDGEIGEIEDFIADAKSWRLRYVRFRWDGDSRIAPVEILRQVRWSDRSVVARVSARLAKTASPLPVEGVYDESILERFAARLRVVRPSLH